MFSMRSSFEFDLVVIFLETARGLTIAAHWAVRTMTDKDHFTEYGTQLSRPAGCWLPAAPRTVIARTYSLLLEGLTGPRCAALGRMPEMHCAVRDVNCPLHATAGHV